ncbi:MAG: T9SS type A sorting domain-containing protein, partial [Bacteroidota bacterium]
MEVNVFPNPTTSSFNLLVKTSTIGTFKARVMDVLGREVVSFTGERDNAIKFGNELKSGVYMIEVREGEKVKTVRVVKY